MFNELIYLVSTEKTKNNVGDMIVNEIKVPRFAKLKSIGQSEFYQAQAQGLKPEIKFVISDYLDYENQQFVIHNNFRYKVLRTFRSGNEIEIVCYSGVKMEVVENGDS